MGMGTIRTNYAKLCRAELVRLGVEQEVNVEVMPATYGGTFLDCPSRRLIRKSGSTAELLAILEGCQNADQFWALFPAEESIEKAAQP